MNNKEEILKGAIQPDSRLEYEKKKIRDEMQVRATEKEDQRGSVSPRGVGIDSYKPNETFRTSNQVHFGQLGNTKPKPHAFEHGSLKLVNDKGEH